MTCPRCHGTGGTGARPEIEDGQEWDGTCDRGGRLPMAGDTGWPRATEETNMEYTYGCLQAAHGDHELAEEIMQTCQAIADGSLSPGWYYWKATHVNIDEGGMILDYRMPESYDDPYPGNRPD